MRAFLLGASMKEKNLTIKKGTTFTMPVRWQDATLTYKTITNITRSGPVRITATGHGCPDGWEAAVMNAGGMREINAEGNPPTEWQIATVIDADTVEFNAVNSAGYRAYTSGGQLVFYAPKSLTGCSSRCKFKDSYGGTLLYEPDVSIDTVGYAVTFTVPATESQDFSFTTAVYDLEVEDADGIVTTLLYGTVEVTDEVTTP